MRPQNGIKLSSRFRRVFFDVTSLPISHLDRRIWPVTVATMIFLLTSIVMAMRVGVG